MDKHYSFGSSASNVNVNVSLPGEKLREEENIKHENFYENYSKNADARNKMWDILNSPQYVDFCNWIDWKDSFFEEHRIVSTPLINSGTKPHDMGEYNALLSSLNNIYISEVKECKTFDVCNNVEANNKENSVKEAQGRITQQETSLRKKRLCKASPISKIPKVISPPAIMYGNEKKVFRKPNHSETPVKKEVCKKETFVPHISKRILKTPITLPLATFTRAKERKRFDDAIKEKEREKEQIKQMEQLARRKEEEEEVARLRKEMIHKAQPIRKYKLGLPEIKKRPLTEPITPNLLKRRRCN